VAVERLGRLTGQGAGDGTSDGGASRLAAAFSDLVPSGPGATRRAADEDTPARRTATKKAPTKKTPAKKAPAKKAARKRSR
jgi:DNA end-binding protein Ku